MNKIKKKIHLSQVAIYTAVVILMVLSLIPIWLMLIKSVKSIDQEIANPIGFTFPFEMMNFVWAWDVVKTSILNTIIISVLQTGGLLLICAIGAYGFTRFNFKGKNVLTIMILALMMIPGSLTLIPQFALADQLNLVGTRMGVILPSIAGSIPFGWLLLKTFFLGVPKDLFEAAEIDGASHVRRFVSVAMPLCLPIIMTLGLMTFLGAWNDLLWPKLILSGPESEELQTISLVLTPFTESYYKVNYSMAVPIAAYVICSIPLLLLFFLTSKQFVKGLSSGAFKM